MPYAIGGGGALGIAIEATYGTFIAPTKWIPIRSESLEKQESKIYRENIRGIADRSGAIQGYYHIAGDVTFEVTADVLVYFMYASRVTPAKGALASGGYPYTFTPAHVASPTTGVGVTLRKTLSVQVNRNQRPFGYTGMSVTQLAFSIDNGLLMCTATLMGLEEAQQSLGSPTWPTTLAMGPTYNAIELPTASVRTDLDTFSLTINDNGDAQNRIKTTGGRAPAFIKWGEREVSGSVDADFDTLTDYNAFLAQTIQPIKFTSVVDANLNAISIVLNATDMDSYKVNLGSIGDLVRANIAYHGIYNTTDVYTIVVNTAESIL